MINKFLFFFLSQHSTVVGIFCQRVKYWDWEYNEYNTANIALFSTNQIAHILNVSNKTCYKGDWAAFSSFKLINALSTKHLIIEHIILKSEFFYSIITLIKILFLLNLQKSFPSGEDFWEIQIAKIFKKRKRIFNSSSFSKTINENSFERSIVIMLILRKTFFSSLEVGLCYH